MKSTDPGFCSECFSEDIFSSPEWTGLDAVLIAPPISLLESPNLALHTLQAVSALAGFKVRVLYADQLFASSIGQDRFDLLSQCLTSPYEQYGERLFCSFAFPEVPPLGRRSGAHGLEYISPRTFTFRQADWNSVLEIYQCVAPWLELIGQIISRLGVRLVGLSSSHQQTAASIAIARELKRRNPSITIALGGSNCHGQMAEGILSASGTLLDFVFSGEAEEPWLDLLQNRSSDSLQGIPRIVPHKPLTALNDLPVPDYTDFFQQHPGGETDFGTDIWINMESSRGCWWGQRHLCTFCGINGDAPQYRAKHWERVYQEIRSVRQKYPAAKVRMTDVLMPRQYLKSLLPRIAQELPGTTIFYEQRADLSLDEVLTLRDAGVHFLQVGIEHFSDSLLRRINKGTTGRDNITLLRYARSTGCAVGWNMLSHVPGDTEDEWSAMLTLIPLLRHLSPPTLLRPVEITRFSPYFARPVEFGICHIKHLDVYDDIFPSSSDKDKIAWLFTGDYDSYSKVASDFMSVMKQIVDEWKRAWLVPIEKLPCLEVHKYGSNKYLLRDTRQVVPTPTLQFIDEKQASVAVLGSNSPDFEALEGWARQAGVVADVSGVVVGLATAPVHLLMEFASLDGSPSVSWSQRVSHFTYIDTSSAGEIR